MTATPIAAPAAPPTTTPARKPRRSWVFHTVMAPVTLLWVLPLVFVILVSVRSFDDIASNGLGTWPSSFTFTAFQTAWVDGHIAGALRNSVIVTIGAVIAVLFLSSLSAFALSRYHIPFGRGILLIMLAGNLLPPQILLIPVAKITTIVFFAFQRHFVSGLLVGANK